ncbi:hypothetical protein [Vagococcus fluvialis]|uniref:hypothetical protein n=1 Tax=Vagococcus fluvialis TaxID=2738 RepID=UPI003B21480C
MELLNLLGEENKDVKKAIQFLLDSELEEAKWYKEKQRFTLEPTNILYCSQREHAIDWFFSKTLWEKKKGKSLSLKKVISSIQCTPLLIYLAIVTNVLEESKAHEIVKKNENVINKNAKQYAPRTIRFEEKRLLLESVEKKENLNLIEEIVNKFIGK